jgi:hypothetical protein
MMRQRLAHYRSRFDMEAGPKTDFPIGCILINEPTFLADDDWVRVPDDWSGNIVHLPLGPSSPDAGRRPRR